MNRTIQISKTIKSQRFGFSSTDIILNLTLKESQLQKGCPQKGERFQEHKLLKGEKVIHREEDDFFIDISVDDDKSIAPKTYTTLLDKTPEKDMKALAKKYEEKGWKVYQRSTQEQKEFYSRKEERLAWKAKEKGLVNWRCKMEPYTQEPQHYQGGFSDELFQEEFLQNYIKSGHAFGWIGNSDIRTEELDKILETTLKSLGATNHEIATYLTSTDGRHLADSLEELTPIQAKTAIQRLGPYIYNISKIYNHPEHKGNFKSSLEIEKKLREKGELFEEAHLPTRQEIHESITKFIESLKEKR